MPDFLLTEADLRARGGGKWRRHEPDVLPCFVADMDFRVAPAVQAAVRRFTDLQDYGYGEMTDLEPLYGAFAAWMERRHRWRPDPALTLAVDDVVQGIVATILAYSDRGQGVIAQTPVYPPFLTSIAATGRELVENRLAGGATGHRVDLEGLEAAASRARVLLLCSPHNPTGRVFTRDELGAMAAIADAHDLVIVADEIHSDLVYPGSSHVPMETVAPHRTVTLTSATKGFNIPGLRTAVIHFGSPELKRRFDQVIPDHLLGRPSRPGVAATIAAWTEGEAWLAGVMRYLEGNRRVVAEWAERCGLPQHPPEATYLAWLDCRGLKLPEGVTPQQHFLQHARVGLSEGRDFGPPGEGFVRLNFATSAGILGEILRRMSAALD